MKKIWTFPLRLLVNDWKSKLLAIMIAITVWFYTTSAVSDNITETATISIEGKSPELIAELATKDVAVTLNGPQQILARFFLKPLMGSISLSKFSLPEGMQKKTIDISTANFFRIPQYLSLRKCVPNKVRVTLIRCQTKLLNVKPNIVNHHKDIEVVSVTSTPNLILVKGPESILSKISHIKTYPIFLGKVNRTNLDISAELVTEIAGKKIEFKTSPKITVHVELVRK